MFCLWARLHSGDNYVPRWHCKRPCQAHLRRDAVYAFAELLAGYPMSTPQPATSSQQIMKIT